VGTDAWKKAIAREYQHRALEKDLPHHETRSHKEERWNVALGKALLEQHKSRVTCNRQAPWIGTPISDRTLAVVEFADANEWKTAAVDPWGLPVTCYGNCTGSGCCVVKTPPDATYNILTLSDRSCDWGGKDDTGMLVCTW